MTRCKNFWRKSGNTRQDAANMRSRPPMKHIQLRLSVTLLSCALVGSACNQASGTKYDAGMTSFNDATITVAPTVASFPNTAVGSDSPVQKFTLQNIGYEATGPISHVISGNNSTEF